MPQNKPTKNENQAEKAQEWVNIKFPPGFAHPYGFDDKNGKHWDKAIVNIPPNTKFNGVDLSGYSIDIFVNDRQLSSIVNREPLTCGFKADEKIELFKGEGADKKTLEVNPWSLTKAIKTQRDEYVAAKTAEREAAKEAPATSLAERAAQAKNASETLHNEQATPALDKNVR